MKTAAVIAVGGLALLSAGGVKADDNKYCVTEARATDIIRLWGYELGETKLKNVQGLPCDGDWDDFEVDARQYKSDMWNQAADALTEAVQPSLAVVDVNSPDNAYLCEDGIKWYTVNSFKGCTLKDGKTFDYRGKTYKNDQKGNKGVMSVAMTVSYVCNKQARVRDMGFSYTTVTKTDCRP